MTLTLLWRSKRLTSNVTHIPALPGIYVIGSEENLLGLEVVRRYEYVGKTTNMRRRLSEHTPWSELHVELAMHLRKHRERIKIWYTVEVQENELNSIERKLIRELSPEFNRIKYHEGKNP